MVDQEMNLALLVYFASIVESVSSFFNTIGILIITAYFATIAIMLICDYGEKESGYELDEDIKRQKDIKDKVLSYWKVVIFSSILFVFMSILLPKERTLYIMAGAYATEQIVKMIEYRK